MSQLNEQHSKMLHLMNWKADRMNESEAPTKTIELTKTGADGNTYAIIRENNRYYLQVNEDASKKHLPEAYQYVGGFMNRSKYTYNSYADAIKDMDLKMYALNEAYAKENEKAIMIETTNPDYKERLVVEGTEQMRQEIARQRQIMANAGLIFENDFKRGAGVGMGPVGHGKPFGDKTLETNNVGPKDGFGGTPSDEPFNANGEPKGNNDPNKPFTKKVSDSITNGGKAAMAPVRMDENNDDPSVEVIDVDGENNDGSNINLDDNSSNVSLEDGEGVVGDGENTPADNATPAEDGSLEDKINALMGKFDAIEDKLNDITKRLDDEDFDDDNLYGDDNNDDNNAGDNPDDDPDNDNNDDNNEPSMDDFEDNEELKEAMARQLARHPRFQQILKEERERFMREQAARRRRLMHRK